MQSLRFRQGDVLLISASPISEGQGQKLPHLVLAEGEVTGHKHQVTEGQAELYEENNVLFLRVLSQTATLVHEEHQPIHLPQGTWMVMIQREYQPQDLKSYHYVED